MDSDKTSEDELPVLIALLKQAKLIGPVEIEALKNQMSLHPDIPLVELVLRSGYVTEVEIESLPLAEYLRSREEDD
jgi:hypothetical protein